MREVFKSVIPVLVVLASFACAASCSVCGSSKDYFHLEEGETVCQQHFCNRHRCKKASSCTKCKADLKRVASARAEAKKNSDSKNKLAFIGRFVDDVKTNVCQLCYSYVNQNDGMTTILFPGVYEVEKVLPVDTAVTKTAKNKEVRCAFSIRDMAKNQGLVNATFDARTLFAKRYLEAIKNRTGGLSKQIAYIRLGGGARCAGKVVDGLIEPGLDSIRMTDDDVCSEKDRGKIDEAFKKKIEAYPMRSNIKMFTAEKHALPIRVIAEAVISDYYNYSYSDRRADSYSVRLRVGYDTLYLYVGKDSDIGRAVYEILEDGEVHKVEVVVCHAESEYFSTGEFQPDIVNALFIKKL